MGWEEKGKELLVSISHCFKKNLNEKRAKRHQWTRSEHGCWWSSIGVQKDMKVWGGKAKVKLQNPKAYGS